MFCENCGSRIPDDAKFCPECGARAAVPDADTPEVILPDFPEVILPDVPDVPDVILPDAPVIPDISQSISHDAEEPSAEPRAAEPAWSVPSQGAAAYEPAPAASPAAAAYEPAPSFPQDAAQPGPLWSIPGGAPAAPSAPARGTQTAEKKPLLTRWWFWLILVVGIGLFALLIIGVVLAISLRNTMPPSDDLPPEIEAIVADTEALNNDIDNLPDFLENAVDIPDAGEDFPLDADDQYVPMDMLIARIDQDLREMGLEHDVYADEDDWVFVDVWTDGLDALAEAAYDGDAASLADWNALAENIRIMSEDYLADLLAGGQHSAVCVVSLLDDLDTSLSLVIAIDGELILDAVTGLDEYGLLEE